MPDEKITIKVKAADYKERGYKIGMNYNLYKVVRKYEEEFGIPEGAHTWIVNGDFIRAYSDATCSNLDVEDEDMIDGMPQHGFKKPVIPTLELTVKANGYEDGIYKIKNNTDLYKVINIYEKKVGITENIYIWHHIDKRILKGQTAEMHDMDEKDEIVGEVHQFGGMK